ncbi:MAG: aldehyde dehydrogenase family protein, partial [Pseudodonghicola sp.]
MLEPILPDNLGLYYGNAWHAPQSGRTDPTFDPATGKVLAQVATAGEADVDAAVASARAGFRDWRDVAPLERARAQGDR